MEQAIFIIMGFMVPGIVGCIIGIIYALYDDKRKIAASRGEPRISDATTVGLG